MGLFCLEEQNEVNNMIMNEKEGTKYPQSGGTCDKTPFTEQSKGKGAGQGSQHLLLV